MLTATKLNLPQLLHVKLQSVVNIILLSDWFFISSFPFFNAFSTIFVVVKLFFLFFYYFIYFSPLFAGYHWHENKIWNSPYKGNFLCSQELQIPNDF